LISEWIRVNPMGSSKEPPNASHAKLLALAVHEFRTPASVVGGYLRMLQRDTESPLTERQRKMIDEAEKSCGRLVALVAELSEVSKLDAGLITLAEQPFDLFPLVEDVAKGVHEAADRDVQLVVRGDAEGARMTGDTPRLRTALHSIFRAILREQAAACTVVADRRLVARNGVTSAVIVIAESKAIQAAYDSTARPFNDHRGGLGLALPIARRVIEGHGGRLSTTAPPGTGDEADERSAGRGTAIITFPLSELTS
jgi:signal transduction histidine kinase